LEYNNETEYYHIVFHCYAAFNIIRTKNALHFKKGTQVADKRIGPNYAIDT